MKTAYDIMTRIFGAALGILAEVSRTMLGRLAWIMAAVWAFLWIPDLDLAWLSVLHHRSILTHSILPALLLFGVRRWAGMAPVAGAMVGISVHLACDMLSPMRGFAQIWLPAPVKMPLGAGMSWLWLGGNAVIGFALALRIAIGLLPGWLGLPFMLILSAATGAWYGAINEQSLAAIAVSTALPALTALWVGRKRAGQGRWGAR